MKGKLTIILTSLLVLLYSGTLRAQATEQDSLYREIAMMDSVLFTAFNTHDLATVKKVFDKDLEFYHDLGGVSGYEENIASIQELFSKNNGLRRELVKGTMEVYPIKDYGAVQIAEHRFCHEESGKTDCGTFKFVHLWKKTADGWKLARVISYGHLK